MSPLVGDNDAQPMIREGKNSRNSQRVSIDAHPAVQAQERRALSNIRVCDPDAVDVDLVHADCCGLRVTLSYTQSETAITAWSTQSHTDIRATVATI